MPWMALRHHHRMIGPATLPISIGERAPDWFMFVLLLALFLLLIVRNVSPEPYVYDEADYMSTASHGFVANWTDTPSISLSDFLEAGLSRAGRGSLSARIRAGNDVFFYRHFHGPLFHYALIPVSRLGLNERATRTALLAIPCAGLAVVYFGCLWLAPLSKTTTPLVAAMLYLSSSSVIGSTELAPHQLFAICSLASLILLLKAIATGQHRYWYGAVAIAGLAFCTLEIALVLMLTLAISCFIERGRWRVDNRFIAKSVAVFLGTVLAIWPAAILRLSPLKSYAVMAYLSASRESPWGNASFFDTWLARILASPLEWLIISLAVIALLRTRSRNLYPLAMFATLMLAANLRVLTLTPRYSLPFVPVLDLFAGLALVPFLGPLRRPASFAVVTLALAGLYGNAWLQVANRPHNPNPRSAAVLTYIHQNGLENKALLAPQADLPTLHYYFPEMRLRGYLGSTPAATEHAGFAADAIIPLTGR